MTVGGSVVRSTMLENSPGTYPPSKAVEPRAMGSQLPLEAW